MTAPDLRCGARKRVAGDGRGGPTGGSRQTHLVVRPRPRPRPSSGCCTGRLRPGSDAIIVPVTEPRPPLDVPTLALPVDQAAAAVGLSETNFRNNVLPHVRSIKVGRARVVPVIEFERWLYLAARFVDDE